MVNDSYIYMLVKYNNLAAESFKKYASSKRWGFSLFANTVREGASRKLLGNEFQDLGKEKPNDFCVMESRLNGTTWSRLMNMFVD